MPGAAIVVAQTEDMIDAVVFDLDGFIIYSSPVWSLVRRLVVAEQGGCWAPAPKQRLMGMSTQEWAEYLRQDLGVALPPEDIAELVIGRMLDRYRDDAPLMPGAQAAVRRLSARWPLGLASSSPPPLIEAVLAGAGLRDCFKAAMSTEEVRRGKPAPDIYLAVTERLGGTPARSAAVEDSTNGLRSAAAAGLHVIAVPHPRYPPEPSALGLAELVLTDLDALTVSTVADLPDSR